MGPECWETALVPCWLSFLTSCLIQQMHLPYEAPGTQNIHILWFPVPLTPHIWVPFQFREQKLLALGQFTADVGLNCQLPRRHPPGQGMRISFLGIPILQFRQSRNTCSKTETGRLSPEHLHGFNASRWELRRLSLLLRLRVKGIIGK